MRRATRFWLALLVLGTALSPLQAQLAPSPQELERYTGLHAAAHRGDRVALDRLLGVRPDKAVLDARDGAAAVPDGGDRPMPLDAQR